MIYGNGKFVEDSMELLDCTIGRGTWRNFEGENGTYDFTIFLPQSLYEEMWDDGWYVKHKEQYAGRDYEYTLEVSFRFDKYPPKSIKLIASDGTTTTLNQSNIDILQTADIERCDVIIRPYNWEKDGNKGVSAKLDSMTVWLKKPRRSINASIGHREEDDD